MAKTNDVAALLDDFKSDPLPKAKTGKHSPPEEVAAHTARILTAMQDVREGLKAGEMQKTVVDQAIEKHGVPKSSIEAAMSLHRGGHLEDEELRDDLIAGRITIGRARSKFTKPRK